MKCANLKALHMCDSKEYIVVNNFSFIFPNTIHCNLLAKHWTEEAMLALLCIFNASIGSSQLCLTSTHYSFTATKTFAERSVRATSNDL